MIDLPDACGSHGVAWRRRPFGNPIMSSLPLRKWYTGSEVAHLLGHSIDRYYRNRVRLQPAYGMPQPVTMGRIRIDKASFDAWPARFHPAMPGPAANFSAPPIGPARRPRRPLARVSTRRLCCAALI